MVGAENTKGRARIACAIACAIFLAPRTTAGQRPEVLLEMSPTIRDALQQSGFIAAASARDAPDLDRRLTSSGFTTSSDGFAAAYYFVDELAAGGQTLGPLHVSRYNSESTRWVQAPPFGDDVGGSVLRIHLSRDYVLIELHRTPSAGTGLVLDGSTLATIASLGGGRLDAMPDGSIRFSRSMVHFAATHQDRLLVFDPKTRKEAEIFPGPTTSPVAATYRRELRAAYGRLPRSLRAAYEEHGDGPISDFDRSIAAVRDRPDGLRLAFVASYGSVRFPGDGAPDPLDTIVRCERRATASWICEERSVTQSARDAGVTLTWDAQGAVSQDAIAALIEASLRKP
jgi:hypothetical protein